VIATNSDDTIRATCWQVFQMLWQMIGAYASVGAVCYGGGGAVAVCDCAHTLGWLPHAVDHGSSACYARAHDDDFSVQVLVCGAKVFSAHDFVLRSCSVCVLCV
jgi:hypothetical protein